MELSLLPRGLLGYFPKSSRLIIATALIASGTAQTVPPPAFTTMPEAIKRMEADQKSLEKKLDSLVIPELKTEGSLAHVVNQLKAVALAQETETAPNERVWINLVVIPSVSVEDMKLTLDLKGVTLRKALATISEKAGCRLRLDPYAVCLVTKEAKDDPKLFSRNLPGRQGAAAVKAAATVIPFTAFDGHPMKEVVDFFNFRMADLSGVRKIQFVVLDPKVDGKAPMPWLELNHTPFDVSLTYCTEAMGCTWIADDKEIRIVPKQNK